MNDGGPAFPQSAITIGEKMVNAGVHGMTLRDYFAAKALQGLIPIIGVPEDREPDELWNAATAKEAYALADAMLRERDKKEAKG